MEERRFELPKIEKIEMLRNPLTNQGVRALAIVLAVIFLISTAVYFGFVRQSKESSSVLPETTTEMPTVTPTEEPTPTSVSKETPASPAGRPTATESTPTN